MTAASVTSVPIAPPELSGALNFHEVNRQHLYAALEVVRLQLTQASRGAQSAAEADDALAAAQAVVERTAALVRGQTMLGALVDLFGLSRFERDVLLLAAGAKLVPDFGVVAAGAERSRGVVPSFELAFRSLAAPHWAAITPGAPLRRYHLLQLDRPDDPVHSAFRIDERILFFLLGLPAIDARFDGVLEMAMPPDSELPAGYARVATQVADIWAERGSGAGERPIIQLSGPDTTGKRAVAAVGCRDAGLALYVLRGADAGCDQSQRTLFARLIDRELILAGAALLIVLEDDDLEETRAVRALVSRLTMPVLIARRDPLTGLVRREARLELEPLGPDDQRSLWRAHLAGHFDGDQDEPLLNRIVGHFRFGPAAIGSVAAVAANSGGDRAQAADALWDACRRRGRSRMSDLAQRIESDVGWDDLVLPEAQKQLLREISSQLAHATTVHERWGFRRRGSRGLGLTALFAGESGTGKTMAAEAIANQVRLDLWRVDLSRMLDKYIGETEKNLRRVFDAAEESGAILLFDEADALFGKRTEVKDSVDRFANVEVGYLLQRMETYGGLAILTTNMRSTLDTAFLRRIRFAVSFPFPRPEERVQIWSRAFPAGTPSAGLNVARLAQLNMSGGSIRNIALNGAFLAAADGRPVGMDHLLRAARGECAKVERALSNAETAGWA